MSLPQVFLCGVGATLVVIGAINRLRKEKGAWRFLLPGFLIFMLGCLVLPL
jgi:hypothetical protein